jgi:DNA-binding IclR family transcriptional regulator
VNAIAIAFKPNDGSALLSINCGGPAFNLSAEFLLNEVRPRLVQLVSRLKLGQ